MVRSLLRFLGRVDDLAEALVVAGGRALWHHRKALLAGAVLTGAGCALVSTAARTFKKRPVERTGVRICVPAPASPAPWSVRSVKRLASGGHEARLSWQGGEITVRAGTPCRSSRGIELVVSRIDCNRVQAIRVPTGSMETSLAPECAFPTGTVSVVAIAGEAPNYVAVIDVAQESFIVENGTFLPDEAHARLKVESVDAQSVTIRDLGTRQVRRVRLLEPGQGCSQAHKQDLDLDI